MKNIVKLLTKKVMAFCPILCFTSMLMLIAKDTNKIGT